MASGGEQHELVEQVEQPLTRLVHGADDGAPLLRSQPLQRLPDVE